MGDLSSNNFGSNMENVSNIADLWSCLPYTEEGFSFEFQYDNMVWLHDYSDIIIINDIIGIMFAE